MITSLAFAQAPLAKKAVSTHKIEKLISADALQKKAKEAKEMKAAMEEKAAAANETSSSAFRKSSVNRGKFESVGGGKEVSTMSLKLGNSRVDNAIYKATTLRTTTQEGNVTVETDANGIITNVTGVEAKYYKRAETGSTYYPSFEFLPFFVGKHQRLLGEFFLDGRQFLLQQVRLLFPFGDLPVVFFLRFFRALVTVENQFGIDVGDPQTIFGKSRKNAEKQNAEKKDNRFFTH